MTSAFTVVLVTFGLLSLVTARPTVIHQKNVDEQGYTALKFLPQQMQADAASVSQFVDAYNSTYAQQIIVVVFRDD